MASDIGNVVGSSSPFVGLAFDPGSNILHGTTGDQLFTIDLPTRSATSVGFHGLSGVEGLAFDTHSGALYGTDAEGGRLILIDAATGAGIVVGENGFSVSGLAFLPGGGTDCDASFVPDACEIDDNDLNGNGLPDICDIAGCAIDDLSCADCNNSLVFDPYELADNDCNNNGIPDECDVDCQDNGIPDECDLLEETSDDCNADGIPDECKIPRVQLLTNGGFESGDFSGWSQISSSIHYSFEIDDGSVAVPGSDGPFRPCGGNFAAAMVFNAVGKNSLYQEVTIPRTAISADLSWTDRIRNQSDVFSDPDHEFRVEIWNTQNEVLIELFSTDPGDPLLSGCTDRVFDVSTFIGETVRIAFTQTRRPYAFDLYIDNVKLAIATKSADCNENGVPDACDLHDGMSQDCNDNATPDECDADEDCNHNMVQDVCDIGTGASDDCNLNDVPDECEPDCDGNGVPDDCDPDHDCNNNTVQDICDIAAGSSHDCNLNSVPDECELSGNDCNMDGVPDDCDLIDHDCNADGVPDDCELAFNDCNDNGIPDECDRTYRLVTAARGVAYELELLTGAATPFSATDVLGFEDVEGLAFDPNTGTLYGSDTDSDQLIAIDVQTGVGTAIGPLGFDDVVGLAFDRNTNTLYGTDSGSSSSYRLISIDVRTGAGTSIGGVAGRRILGLAFDANTNTLYGASWDRLYSINTTTGSIRNVGEIGFNNLWGLAFDARTDTLYGQNVDGLLTIDTTTGTGMFVGHTGFRVVGLAFDPDSGTLHGVTSSPSSDPSGLVTIDTGTGAGTSVEGLGFRTVRGLAYDRNTNTLYGVVPARTDTELVTIDVNRGTGSLVGLTGVPGIRGLAFDPNANKLYGSVYWSFTNNHQLVTIDVVTGIATVIGDLGHGHVDSLAFDRRTNTLYGVSLFEPQLITIDTVTGETSFVGATASVDGLAFDPRTSTLYGISGGHFSSILVAIDVTTGDWSIIGNTPSSDGVDGLAFGPGRSLDCNGSGIADLCELVDNDCNANGVPDECDVDVDFDGDGFLDECDACLDSDLAELILVEECATGVPNELLDDGCTMNDVLNECTVGAHSHGKLTACVARHTNEWRRQGLLSGKDVGRIVRCAGTSNEHRPSKRVKDRRSHRRR